MEETQMIHKRDSSRKVDEKYLVRAQDGCIAVNERQNVFSHDSPIKRASSALSETRFYNQQTKSSGKKKNKYSNNRNMTFVEARE